MQFSQHESLVISICILLIVTRAADRLVFRFYASRFVSNFPLNKWLAFDDVQSFLRCPSRYTRRILIIATLIHLLEFRANEALLINDEEANRRYEQAMTGELGYMELLEYRMKVRPRRRRALREFRADTPPFGIPVPVRI